MDGMTTKPRRPVLRYHGGKWMLAPWIISHFPEHRIYVEPYGGGASVLIQKPRSYAEVYNELDSEVVNVFQVLRDPDLAAELRRVIELTPFARDEFYLAYKPHPDPVEQARRTVFRSMAGFGSAAASGHQTGFRSNSNRSGTTPAYNWSHYPNNLAAFCSRLRGVVVENCSAAEVINRHDTDETLHYVDPPYPRSTRSSGGHYDGAYRHEMTDDDHRDLAGVLRHVQGMVVLSGYHSDLYDKELYPDWISFEREALADGAKKRIEVLWLNPAAAGRISKQDSLFG